MSRSSAIEDVLAAHRELNPELYAKADALAEIIDPSAWPGEAYRTTDPNAEPIDWSADARVQYMRAVARGKAFQILEYLGLYDPSGWCTPALLAKAWGWKDNATPSEQPNP